MSLVFLKNKILDDEDDWSSRPLYQWTNTFDTPLKLPPNSQVAYIQSTIALAKSLSIASNNDALYVVIGNPSLNPTMRVPLPLGQPNDAATLAQIITSQLNTWSLQADFKTSEQVISAGGLITNLNGWNCIYDPLALKFNYGCIQRKTNGLKTVDIIFQ